MNNCTISVYLAYGMAAYVIASIYYMVTTRFVGTPFRDSLTAKQIIIKLNLFRIFYKSSASYGGY